ncbi:MAG: Gfo/Idh/MocA family protein [Alphaproteobacteria bacterium]
MSTIRLAVAGAGLMGRRHVAAIRAQANADLVAIADPSDAARDYSADLGVAWHENIGDLLAADPVDGVILAIPNQLHVAQGLDCVAAGVPMLIEKPIASDVASATTLVGAAEAAGVPILVGHHRRHNAIIRKARALIEDGAVGRIVAVQAMFWLYKPDDYFETAWRREPGAGPVFINLIHDLDLLRFLCGDIERVVACESNAIRGNPVEDTAAVILRFESGALGTVTLSDTVVAPWSWEMTAKENPAYPRTDEACYRIGGTHGSLELPNLRVWRHRDRRSWWEPIDCEDIAARSDDPITVQMDHFCRVIRGLDEPLVTGREAIKTLAVVEAIKAAAG